MQSRSSKTRSSLLALQVEAFRAAVLAAALLLSLSRTVVVVAADAETPKKYALLAAVSKYEHAEMNRPQPLEFPEADAAALAAVLREAGYATEMLVGAQATKMRIEAALSGLKRQGNDTGAVIVAFFGHGVELGVTQNGRLVDESFFCPYDVTLRNRRDAQGRDVPGENGKPLIEPDPNDCVGMTAVFNAVRLSKAGRRIVIADCCRNDPTAARGRGFGANVSTADLPERTAALFSCSSGEKAFEDSTLGHGVFTKALLDRIARHSGSEPLTAAILGEHLEDEVPQRVKRLTQGAKQQTPRYVSISKVDLLLGPSRTLAPALLTAPFSEREAQAAQRAWATHLKTEPVLTNKLGMRLALVPPGEFLMGSSAADVAAAVAADATFKPEFAKDEQPQRRVRITQPYWLGVYEVTQQEWETVMGDQPAWFSPSGGGKERVSGLDTSRFPVETVSWEQATEYCRKLSQREGRTYRLPTEAEWEYACRAGTTTAFHFGDVLNGDKANVDGNYPFGTTTKGKYLERPTRVGSYGANAFGLHDLHGNVYEWCRDWYEEEYYGRGPSDDPENTTASEYRVLRGGSWNDLSWSCRSANRFRGTPDCRYNYGGFRVLCMSR